MLALGGYYGYTVMTAGTDNTMTPAATTAQMPAQDVNIPSNNTMPPGQNDLSAYEAGNSGDLIGDNAFNENDAPAGMFDGQDMPNDPFAEYNSENTAEIPFNNPNNTDEIVSIETLEIDDLTNEPGRIDAPATANDVDSDVDNAILNAFDVDETSDSNVEIVEVEAPNPADLTANPNTASAPQMNVQNQVLKRQITSLNDEISAQEEEIAALKADLKKAQAAAQKAQDEAAAAKASAKTVAAKPAPAKTAPVNDAYKPAPVNNTYKPAADLPKWFLRAADENTAYISKTITGELVTVSVGSVIPEYGVVKSIAWSQTNGWQIFAENGIISQ